MKFDAKWTKISELSTIPGMAKLTNKEYASRLIIGILFFSVGAGFGVWMIGVLYEANEMLGWSEVPARILECEMNSHRGSKGGTSYSVGATYSYEYGGGDGVESRKYTSTRVDLMNFSSSEYSKQKKKYANLHNAKISGETVTCFVDPDNPNKAVLFRTPELVMILFSQIFAISFSVAGMTLACWVIFQGRGRKIKTDIYRKDFRDTRQAYDGYAQPQNQIRMEGEKTHRIWTIVSLTIGAYVFTVLFFLIRIFGFGKTPWWVCTLLIPVLALVWVAIYHWRRFKKYGVSVLTLTPCPAVSERTLQCVVRIPVLINTEIKTSLRYTHQYTTKSGKNRSTRTDILWRKNKTVTTCAVGENESLVKLEYEIPADSPSTAPHGIDGYWWELSLKSKTRGVNYHAVFEVPVIK